MLVVFLSGALERFERQSLNGLFHWRGAVAPKTPLVIVTIDEDSIDEIGLPWPWPRQLHADLVTALGDAGASAIGFDVLFSEPSAWGAEDDEALANAIREAGNVVLAAALTTVREAGYVKEDLNPPLPSIREGAAGFGPVNFVLDDDAYVRSAALVHDLHGRRLPGFGLVLYRVAESSGVVGAPRPDDGTVRINFRGPPGTFAMAPFHRVISRELPPETFRGKIVLVGATSPALHDVFPTAFAPGGTMPGVEIHANLLETISQGIGLRRLPQPWIVLLALAVTLLAIGITERLRPLPALAWIGGGAVLFAAIGLAAFSRAYLWIDQVVVPFGLFAGWSVTTVDRFVREQREKRRLSRFFSPAVVREVVRARDERALGSARRTITVLFCDIRGFTSISERLPPEDVAKLLREYMTTMTEAAFRHGGTVDKFIGDAIMVLYNAPFEQPEHAVEAVRTALEFQERVRELSERWEARLGAPLRNGVGIHTGDAVVGILGSDQRLEYTAVGDTVNVAARLESLTRELDAPIVVSGSTWEAVRREFEGRRLGAATVKGREEAVEVYAIDGERAAA